MISKLWQFKDGNLIELKGDSYLATRVSEFVLEPQVHHNPSPPPPAHVVRPSGPPSNLAHTPAPTTSPIPAGQHPVGFHLSNNVLYVRLDNRQVGLGLDKPFRVYGLTAENSPSSAAGQSPQAADVLGNFTGEQTGFNLVLRHPSYPICFPESQYVKAGGSVPMQVQGLTPQSQVNAYFDTEPLVGRFTTSSNGSMTVGEFAIPADATNGLHPVTFAVDGTAIAALCEVNVVGGVSIASSTLGELQQGQPVKQPSSNQTKHLDNLTITEKVAPTPSPKPLPLSTPTPQLKVTQLTVKLQADSTEATAPATINFKTATSGSTQPYVYSWDFGDGSSNNEKGNSAGSSIC